MKISILSSLFIVFLMNQSCTSQTVIPLASSNSGHEWPTPEREYMSTIWNNSVTTNVSKPEMLVFRPEKPNGTAVIICPGGGMYALSIDSEDRDVAKWLSSKGVTAFVLKYRLVPTGKDGTADMMTEGEKVLDRAGKMLPYAVEDGLNAIQHVRENAEHFGIQTDKIGLIGFSAGGAVTMGVTYSCDTENCPDFIGPIYAWMNIVPKQIVPKNAPPMFAVCASDDPLDLAPASITLYQEWTAAGKESELHMYAKGGHGFGMKTQNLPSDSWIERFEEWMIGAEIMKE